MASEQMEILSPEHFDSAEQYRNYRLTLTKKMMNLNMKKSKDFVIPKLNLKGLESINKGVYNLRINPELMNRKNYKIIQYKDKSNPPSNLYAEQPVLVSEAGLINAALPDVERSNSVNPVEKKANLDFISDKTHSESKKILQGLQELYTHVKQLRNDPHQMLTLPEAMGSHGLGDYQIYIKKKINRKCSAMGRIISVRPKKHLSLGKDLKYYDPDGPVKMFDFSTPCPN